MKTEEEPTVVLVHAAWADGSSWHKVAALLTQKGHAVVAAQIPLTSLTDDVEALRRLIRRQAGGVVLVGHSYGGAVITAAGAGEPRVKALVYIAAIAPDAGETVGELFTRRAPHPKAPPLQPDGDGYLWMTPQGFGEAVAPDASSAETSWMAAAQKPIAVKCLGEALTGAAWRERPSWFLIAENDRMVSPDTQRFAAERMKSAIVSLPVDHTPLASNPEAVSNLIEHAISNALPSLLLEGANRRAVREGGL